MLSAGENDFVQEPAELDPYAGRRFSGDGTVQFKQAPRAMAVGGKYDPLLADQELPDDSADSVEHQGHPPDTGNKGSVWNGVANLSNVILGSGIIGLPLAVQQSGLLLGVALLIFTAWIADYSLRLVVEAGVKVKKLDYEEVFSFCFGDRAFQLVLLVIFLLDFGTMVSYIVIIGDSITPPFHYYGSDVSRDVLILAVAGGVLLPLCLLRELNSLSWVSLASVATICLIVVLVSVEGMRGERNPEDPEPSKEIVWFGSSVFTAFGTMSFAYVCHDLSFQVFQSLKVPSKRNWAMVARGTVSIAFLASIILSMFGYFSFYDTVKSNILNNFANGNHVINAVRMMLALAIVLTFPLNLFMARHVIARLLGYTSAADLNRVRHVFWTLVLFGFAVLLGVLVKDLGLVQSLVGGLTAVNIAFIFPAAVAVKVDQIAFDRPIWCWANWGPISLFCFGVVIMIVSTIQTIYEAFE